MLLITIFVELRVVAGRSWKQAGSPQAVSRRPCCAVALRRTAWSEHGMGAAWQVWIRHGRTVKIKWERRILKTLSGTAWQGNGMGAAWARHAMCVNQPLVGPLPYPHIGYGFFTHNVRNKQNVDVIRTQHSCHFLTPACLIFRSISEQFVNWS